MNDTACSRNATHDKLFYDENGDFGLCNKPQNLLFSPDCSNNGVTSIKCIFVNDKEFSVPHQNIVFVLCTHRNLIYCLAHASPNLKIVKV